MNTENKTDINYSDFMFFEAVAKTTFDSVKNGVKQNVKARIKFYAITIPLDQYLKGDFNICSENAKRILLRDIEIDDNAPNRKALWMEALHHPEGTEKIFMESYTPSGFKTNVISVVINTKHEHFNNFLTEIFKNMEIVPVTIEDPKDGLLSINIPATISFEEEINYNIIREENRPINNIEFYADNIPEFIKTKNFGGKLHIPNKYKKYFE